MEIIEQSVVPKSKTAEAEDGIVVTDNFVAVIDGSTSKSPISIDRNTSNGRLCMLLISEYISSVAEDVSLDDFCIGLTRHVAMRYGGDRLDRLAEHPEERLTASCVVYSRRWRQIWLIGDCQCLVDGCLYDNPKPCEAVIAGKRAATARKLLQDGVATVAELRRDDMARRAVIPELIETMRGQNITYPVVDGFAIPMELVRTVGIPRGAHSIVLASDGYPFLKSTLAESERLLMDQLASDPLNINSFKATKAFMEGNNSFDDRAYIRFEI